MPCAWYNYDNGLRHFNAWEENAKEALINLEEKEEKSILILLTLGVCHVVHRLTNPTLTDPTLTVSTVINRKILKTPKASLHSGKLIM